jgi:hypothetical protein
MRTRWAVVTAVLTAVPFGCGQETAEPPARSPSASPRPTHEPLQPSVAFQSASIWNEASGSLVVERDDVSVLVLDFEANPRGDLKLLRVSREGIAMLPLGPARTHPASTHRSLAPGCDRSLFVATAGDDVVEGSIRRIEHDGAVAWEVSTGLATVVGLASHGSELIVVRSPNRVPAGPADSSVRSLSSDGVTLWDVGLPGTLNRAGVRGDGAVLVASSCPYCEPDSPPQILELTNSGDVHATAQLPGYSYVLDVLALENGRFVLLAEPKGATDAVHVVLAGEPEALSVIASITGIELFAGSARATTIGDMVYVAYADAFGDTYLASIDTNTAGNSPRMWLIASATSEGSFSLTDLAPGPHDGVSISAMMRGNVTLGSQRITSTGGFDAVVLQYSIPQ